MADSRLPGGTPSSGSSKKAAPKWDQDNNGVPDVLDDPDQRKALLRKYGYTERDLELKAKRDLFYQAVRKDMTRKEANEARDKVYVNDESTVREIVEESGFTMALIKSYPELREIFRKLSDRLARGKITEKNLYEEFRDLIAETDFGKRTNEEIAADLDRYGRNNRANWRKRVADAADRISKFHFVETGGQMDKASAEELAIELIYAGDETDTEAIADGVRKWITKNRTPDGEDAPAEYRPGGQRGRVQADLASWFSANGLIVSRGQMDKYIDDIMAGSSTVDELKQWYRTNRLSVTYAGYADDFARGMDASEIALDFRSTMADLLERNIEDIDFADPLVQRAMQRRGEDGKAMPMTRYEFEQEVRKTDEWQRTDNAMTAYTDIGENILRSFGFRG